MAHYRIKLASFKDVQLMVDWAAAEQWNPGLNDAAVFQTIDLDGFFMGYLGDEPVSSISLVKYTPEFSFLGLYIVKPEHRGKRLGYQIWQHAIQYAGHSNIGLDGVVAQQANYRKSGFKLAHKNTRYLLPPTVFKHEQHRFVISANLLPFSDIAHYDRACFPCDRRTFLTSWLLMNNAAGLVYYDKKIKGYGVIRACQIGYKIGPLFADNREIAHALLQALINTVDQKSAIYLDVPETNPEANQLAQELAMKPVFETARMYTQTAPLLAMNKIFGMTAFEIG